ncbi:histone methyltransferase set2, partial [Nowakowskiella sp. JEL0078]
TKAQRCYCGESICSGVIGSSKMSDLRIGDDDFDDEDIMVRAGIDARTGKKIDLPPGPMETIEDVQRVVKSMLRMSSKPSKTKQILQRIEATDSIAMQKKFLQYHGLVVLKQCLGSYLNTEHGICAQVVHVLMSLPIASRNLVVETNVEEYVLKFREVCEADAAAIVDELLDSWRTLPTLYKIPKRQFVPEINSPSTDIKSDTTFESNTNSLKRPNSDHSDNTPLKRQQIERITTAYRRNSNERAFQLKQIDNSTHTPPLLQVFTSSPTPTQDLNYKRTLVASAPNSDILPGDWRSARADDGRIYYYNTQTRETSWEIPRSTVVVTNVLPVVYDDDDMVCWSPSDELQDHQAARKRRHALRKAEKLAAGNVKKQKSEWIKNRDHGSKRNTRMSDHEFVKENSNHRLANDRNISTNPNNNHKSQWDFEKKTLRESDKKTIERKIRQEGEKQIKLEGEKRSRPEVEKKNRPKSDKIEGEKRKIEPNMKKKISQAVIKYLSHHKHAIDNDKFKKIARKITHALQERQANSASSIHGGDNGDGEEALKKRAKKYVFAALRKEGISVDTSGDANVDVDEDNEEQDMEMSP